MVAGRLGVTDGFDIDQSDTISEHPDGAPTGVSYIVDLSHLLSEQLGKQMSMMETYRIKYISINLRNVDDLNDNDYGFFAGGIIDYYAPTQWRVDAMQAARQWKRDAAVGSGSSDPFSTWTDEKSYKGTRINFSGDGDVESETSDDTSVMAGTYFSFEQLFDHFNLAKGGTPVAEGRPASGEGMALWNTRTGLNEFDSLYWTTYIRNSQYQDGTGFTNAFLFQPEIDQWVWQSDANHLAVLGGLLRVTLQQTNTENPRAGDIDDDYNICMTIGVEGWSGF